MIVHGGSQDVSTYFILRLSADGTEATGLTVTNFDLQYTRSGDTPAAKVDASALGAANSSHADNSAIEIDATDQPGLYRVDWPDAAFAAGVREVILSVKCATCFTEHLRVQIDPPVNVEQWNGTDVPSEHTAGYPIVTVKDGTGTGEIDTTSGGVLVAAIAANTITAAVVASDAVTEIQSGLSTHSAADVWAVATRVLTALDEDTTTLDLDATIRAALGMSSANLDQQLSGVAPVFYGNPTAAASSTLTINSLDTGTANLTDYIVLVKATASGSALYQARRVTDWNNSTKVLSISPGWNNTPTTSDTIALVPSCYANVGLWRWTAVNSPSSGRIDTTVGAMQSDVLTSTALATSAVTEIQSGLATAAALATVDGIVDDILVDTAEIGVAGAGLTNINLPDQAMNITGDITGNLSGSVGSVTATVDADVVAIDGGDDGLAEFAAWTETLDGSGALTAASFAADISTEIRSLASGTADSGSTITLVDAARMEADDDYWKGALLVFTSGNIAGQARVITGFTASSDTLTFAPATTQAVTTQTYEIWPAGDFLRPTTTGRTLDVSTGGEAGIDWANVGSPTTTVNLSGTTVKTATDVETDTQDIQSRIGTPSDLGGGASLSANLSDIESQTDDIGVAGAGLTNINLPDQTMNIVGNITGNLSGSVGSVTANVNAVLADAAHGGTSATLRLGGSSSTPAFYVTNSAGAAVQFEATGGHNHGLRLEGEGNGAGLWSLGGSGGQGGYFQGTNNHALQCHVASGSNASGFSASTGASGTSYGIDTATMRVTTSSIAWNSAWDAEVQSEVDDALVAQRLDELLNADSDIDGAAPPTVGSVFHELLSKTTGSFTFDQTTDSLEALRDRGDAAWVTGGTGLDAAGVRDAVGLASANLDTQLDAIPTAAEVWAYVTRTLTAATNITSTGGTTVPQTGDSFARIGATGSGLTSLATQASVDVIDGIVDAILVDTAAMPANFSSLVISGAGIVAADVESINGTTIIGDGSSGNKFRV